MAYTKTDWMDGQTVVNEANLDKMEQGIYDAHVLAEAQIADAEKGQPLGVATLGADGKVPTAQLPPQIPGITWEGVYSAVTSYQPGDVVSYNGRYWLAVQNSSGTTPS
jgi:hypothetical protein